MKSKPPSKRIRTDQNSLGNGNGRLGSVEKESSVATGTIGLKKENDASQHPATSTSITPASTIEEIKSSMAAKASEIFTAAKKFIISSRTMTATATSSSASVSTGTFQAASATSSSTSSLLVPMATVETTSTSSRLNNSNSLLNTFLPFPHLTLPDLNNCKDFPRLSHFIANSSQNQQQQLSPPPLSPPPPPPPQQQKTSLANCPNSISASIPSSSSVVPGSQSPNCLLGPGPGPEKDPGTVSTNCHITLEEVDGVQAELETLWSHLSVRIRSLEKEHLTIFGVPYSPPPSSDPDKNNRQRNCSSSPSSRSPTGGHSHSHGTRTNTCNSPTKLLMLSSSVCATAASPVRLSDSPGSPSMHRKLSMASTSAAATSLTCLNTNNNGSALAPFHSMSATNLASGGLLPASSLKYQKLPTKKLKGDKAMKCQRGCTKPATRAGQNRAHSMALDGGSSSAYRQAAPNQFWDYADSFCHDITYADFDALERTIEEHQSLPQTIFDIPPLGQHFKNNAPSSPTLRCRDRIETRSQDTCGPLTQRLVSALVDRSVANYIHSRSINSGAVVGSVNSSSSTITNGNGTGPSPSTSSNRASTSAAPPENVSDADNEVDNNQEVDIPCNGMYIDQPGLLHALGLIASDPSSLSPSSSQPLEARVRKVLRDQGLLNADEMDGMGGTGQTASVSPSDSDGNSSDALMLLDDPKDEILQDIKLTQEKLRHLHEYNSEKLKQLHLFARRELDRMEGKRDLEKADKELMEAYRVVTSSRAKKKPLSRREREVATRALENRRSALCKLYGNFGPATSTATATSGSGSGSASGSGSSNTTLTPARHSTSSASSSSSPSSPPNSQGRSSKSRKAHPSHVNDVSGDQQLVDPLQQEGATSDDGSTGSSSPTSSTECSDSNPNPNHGNRHNKKAAPFTATS